MDVKKLLKHGQTVESAHAESKPIIKNGVKIHGKPEQEHKTKIVGGGIVGDVEIKGGS